MGRMGRGGDGGGGGWRREKIGGREDRRRRMRVNGEMGSEKMRFWSFCLGLDMAEERERDSERRVCTLTMES